MPKTIVREFDESTTGFSMSSEFAVVIPGYAKPDTQTQALIQEAIDLGIICEPSNKDIYKLQTQAQFKRFIGKVPAKESTAKAPVLTTIPSLKEMVMSETNHPIDKLITNRLRYGDFWDATIDAPISDYDIYDATEVLAGDDDKGKNRHLVKTFSAAETGSAEKTYRFEKVSARTVLDRGLQTGTVYYNGTYALIKKNDVGADKVLEKHIGNQMAFMLLGLGYTIYYKVLKDDTGTLAQLQDSSFWEPFKNKVTYQFRYLSSGGCYDPTVYQNMTKVAELYYGHGEGELSLEEADTFVVNDNGGVATINGRGDCIALLDVNEEDPNYPIDASTQEKLIRSFAQGIKNIGIISKYAAIFAPRVVYRLDASLGYGSGDVKFPASFHYLACAANAQTRFNEWYAVAGYTRGVSTLPIKYVTYTFGEIAINTLAPRVKNTFTGCDVAANLILSERGSYYLWGNRTAAQLDNDGLIFSHFLNIRQLCATLKKVIFQASRSITFSPNSDSVWLRFVSAITPTLEKMKNDNGINGYLITKVASKKKALLTAKIRIIPIEALEDFDISVYLKDSLDGIILDTDEEVAE